MSTLQHQSAGVVVLQRLLTRVRRPARGREDLFLAYHRGVGPGESVQGLDDDDMSGAGAAIAYVPSCAMESGPNCSWETISAAAAVTVIVVVSCPRECSKHASLDLAQLDSLSTPCLH